MRAARARKARRVKTGNHRRISQIENDHQERQKARTNHRANHTTPENRGRINHRPDQVQADLEGLKNRVRENRLDHRSVRDHRRDRLVQDRAEEVILEAIAVAGDLRGEDDRVKLNLDDTGNKC